MNEITTLEKLFFAFQNSKDNSIHDTTRHMVTMKRMWEFWLSKKFIVLATCVAFCIHFIFWIIVAAVKNDFKLFLSFTRSCALSSYIGKSCCCSRCHVFLIFMSFSSRLRNCGTDCVLFGSQHSVDHFCIPA